MAQVLMALHSPSHSIMTVSAVAAKLIEALDLLSLVPHHDRDEVLEQTVTSLRERLVALIPKMGEPIPEPLDISPAGMPRNRA